MPDGTDDAGRGASGDQALPAWLKGVQAVLGRLQAIPALKRNLPILTWLGNYRRADFAGDLTAGIIVAIMLVPQSMAYAMLAGMPPQSGLYAAIVPLILYAMFGTSRALAVGPVAIVCLMVASALTPLAQPGSAQYVALGLTLAFLSGVFLVALGALRLGAVTNFLSHPVLAGFTSAAAVVIGVSQLKDLIGTQVPNSTFLPSVIWGAIAALPKMNIATAVIGALSVAALVWRTELVGLAKSRGYVGGSLAGHLTKGMPLIVVAVMTLLTWLLGLGGWAGVKVVGTIPQGLPPLTWPPLDTSTVAALIVPAMLISLIGFLESVSVAKSLASRRRQSIEANAELKGLGAANIGAALTGGFPVTGGFSRSMVNFSAGANTQLATLITVGIIVAFVVALTPLLYHLPRAVLAAIVVTAVANLFDLKPLRHAWAYDKIDGLGYLATFVAVLTLGVDIGIVVGVASSLLLHLMRTSKPHIAIVGRVKGTEHFRNVLRHPVETHDTLLLMRIDESLYFANAAYLEEQVLKHVAENAAVKHFVLICPAVNAIDASALETLETLAERLKAMGLTMHLAEVKGPVMDRLDRTDLLSKMAPGRVFLTVHEAVLALAPDEVPRSRTPTIIRAGR
ncbi:MAG TPA: sulfate permease [Hyphomicrobiaceae bacterium]|nr:sulfate permease [Hyphomicrobiaceae bacterium]